MPQSAAYYYATDTSVTLTTAPSMLVAVLVTGSGDAGTVTITNGSHGGGDAILAMSAANGTSAAFTPAVPIALHKGIGIIANATALVTVVYY